MFLAQKGSSIAEPFTNTRNKNLFIAKTYSCWELTFAADSNSSESSIESSSSVSDADLTDTSELAQPLAE
jgi:hypothetical protein